MDSNTAKRLSRNRKKQSTENAKDDSQFVAALGRGLDILLAFSNKDHGLGNQELAERTGLALPTVSRLTYTLLQKGFLDFDPRRREYHLGMSSVRLGTVAHSMTNERTLAAPLLQKLASDSGFNVGLGSFDRGEMVFSDVFEGGGVLGLRLYPGYRLPVLNTANGRAYLATLNETQKDDVFASITEADDLNKANEIAENAKYESEQHGFSISAGDWHPGICSVGKAIRPLPGRRTWVCLLGGPASMLSREELQTNYGPRLAEVVKQIEAQLPF